MQQKNPALDTLEDIRQIMERSSRFISLSGLSGVAAGICALTGAWFAHRVISGAELILTGDNGSAAARLLSDQLLNIAMVVLCAAIILAFWFTYLKSKKSHIPVWGTAAKRLVVNLGIPLLAGGVFLLHMTAQGYFKLIAPGCLLWYGIALVNAGKYTLGEVRYLGYVQIVLGLTSCWFPEQGLYFWAMGFGVMHIIYGAWMWWKYDKKSNNGEASS
ncbi:MAG TPA: hypothetical protein PLL71_02400 [Agriterribacter sp.]|nr:hypothetical protein [Agriterribacter sp.]HRQ49810.1 hypothetical protein [Agriterribacter sp.]